MSKNKTNNYKNHGKRVYQILLDNFQNGLPGMVREDIEAKARKRFGATWGLVIREARRLALEDDLIIPRATMEGGWVYEVTDDPNKVMPGMLIGIRQTHGMREAAFSDRDFIRRRESELNPNVNGSALELADLALDAEKLVQRATAAVQGQLTEAMATRRGQVGEAVDG